MNENRARTCERHQQYCPDGDCPWCEPPAPVPVVALNQLQVAKMLQIRRGSAGLDPALLSVGVEPPTGTGVQMIREKIAAYLRNSKPPAPPADPLAPCPHYPRLRYSTYGAPDLGRALAPSRPCETLALHRPDDCPACLAARVKTLRDALEQLALAVVCAPQAQASEAADGALKVVREDRKKWRNGF